MILPRNEKIPKTLTDLQSGVGGRVAEETFSEDSELGWGDTSPNQKGRRVSVG